MEPIVDQTGQAIRRTIEDMRAVFSTGGELANPAVLMARLSDLARSNFFLWTEASLQTQERFSRVAPAGLAWSRMLALATVATDILVGYTTLRERARWVPHLVSTQDWE